jgi:hypothetical protein
VVLCQPLFRQLLNGWLSLVAAVQQMDNLA